MSVQVVAKPQGIITEPNKVGQFPPGAFSYAKNCAIRAFGVLEQVPKWSDFIATGENLVGGIYAASEGDWTVFLYEHTTLGTWQVYAIKANSYGGYSTFSFAIAAPFSTYITNDARTGVIFARNRLIVTGTVRSFAVDFVELPGGGHSLVGPRNCGLYQAVLYDRNTTSGATTDPAYLGPNEHFSATCTVRAKFADGYELVGCPAIPYDFVNLSTTLPQVRSDWTIDSVLSMAPSPHVEYKLDVYRTRAQSVGYDSVGNKYRPVSTGSSFYLSKTVDRVTTFQPAEDTTLPSTLGEALLTNVSVGGASALPLPPTPSKTACVFRGHAFYANRWDPATFTLLNPYYWGFMNMATATSAQLVQGIGYRFTSSGQTSVNANPTVTGFPNTTGVVAGQTFNVYRTDTLALVSFNNRVLSKTATTITGTTNVTYSGAVRADIIDRIEINGVNVSAMSSPQGFVSQLFAGLSDARATMDVAAVGLEPITVENPVGVYPNFVPTGGMAFRMRTNSAFTIRATNGQNYSPKLPAIDATVLTITGKQQKNGYAWSENNEPENCPPSNYAFAGSGEIYKIIATRDCLWFFCSDGLYRLSGAGGSVGEEYDWVLDPVDPSLVITNPDCACVYREYVYAYTNRGFVSINSEGVVRQLSDGRINPSWSDYEDFNNMALPNKAWTTDLNPTGVSRLWNWVAADPANDEVWVREAAIASGGTPGRIWVYNVKTDTWTLRQPTLYDGDVASLVSYNSTYELLFGMYSGRDRIVVSGPTSNSTAYEEATVNFQPIYGASTGAPYTLKHWQDVNLSFRTPHDSAIATCQLRSQTVTAGTRVIPAASATGNQMEMARVGFTIPRAFPAMANSLTVELVISPPAAGIGVNLQPVKLEGMQINYVDFTEQRVKR